MIRHSLGNPNLKMPIRNDPKSEPFGANIANFTSQMFMPWTNLLRYHLKLPSDYVWGYIWNTNECFVYTIIAHYRYTNILTPTIAPCLKVFWAQEFWIRTWDHFYFRAIGKWTFCVRIYTAQRTRSLRLYSRCSVIYPASLETKRIS